VVEVLRSRHQRREFAPHKLWLVRIGHGSPLQDALLSCRLHGSSKEDHRLHAPCVSLRLGLVLLFDGRPICREYSAFVFLGRTGGVLTPSCYAVLWLSSSLAGPYLCSDVSVNSVSS
jgi:hypothetical protein